MNGVDLNVSARAEVRPVEVGKEASAGQLDRQRGKSRQDSHYMVEMKSS